MMVTPTNHAIARAESTLREPLAIWRFLRHLPACNIGKGQKKSYHLKTEPLALCLMVNQALVFTLRS